MNGPFANRRESEPLPDGRGSVRSGDNEQNRDREGAAKGHGGPEPLGDTRASEPLADTRGSEPLADTRGSVRSGDNEQNREREGAAEGGPLAYLITFRTYGTWLHGDERGSVDREHNVYGTPMLAPDPRRERAARLRCRQQPVRLNADQRRIVQEALLEVIKRQNWSLHELNVRSNHVHAVVSAPEHPDRVANTLKAISTRRLREAGLIDAKIKPWSRGGSRKYLWTPEALEAACRYVLDGQGEDI